MGLERLRQGGPATHQNARGLDAAGPRSPWSHPRQRTRARSRHGRAGNARHPCPQSPRHAKAARSARRAPLAAPSANAANRPNPTCAGHVLRTLNGRIARDDPDRRLQCQGGLRIHHHRRPKIRFDRLKTRCRLARSASALNAELATVRAAKAPTHRLPQPLRASWRTLFTGGVPTRPDDLKSTRACVADGHAADAPGRKRLTESLVNSPRPLNSLKFLMPDTPEQFGSRLYQVFYRIEALHLAGVGVEDLGDAKLGAAWWALQDRLLRAASERISSE